MFHVIDATLRVQLATKDRVLEVVVIVPLEYVNTPVPYETVALIVIVPAELNVRLFARDPPVIDHVPVPIILIVAVPDITPAEPPVRLLQFILNAPFQTFAFPAAVKNVSQFKSEVSILVLDDPQVTVAHVTPDVLSVQAIATNVLPVVVTVPDE